MFEHLDKTAIISSTKESFLYRDLYKLADDLSRNFKGKYKKLIFILCDNNIESIIGYIASLRSNNAVCLLDSKINKELLEQLLKKFKPNYIWQHKKNNQNYSFSFRDYGLFSYCQEDLKISKDISVLLSTSGSTGSSKLVKLSNRNLYSNAKGISEYLSLSHKDKPITTLPFYYSYGLSVINSHFLIGSTVLLSNYSVVQKEFWNFFKEYEATSLSGVPYTYEILKNIGFFRMNLPSLNTLTQAGGKLKERYLHLINNYANEKNLRFFVMYGQTEATARMTYLPNEFREKKINSIGIPIPKGKIYLVDKDDKLIEKANVEGEIVYEGDNVMLGYALNKEDLSYIDKKNNILRTNDIGYKDKEGFFYISGRKSSFIKILGNRVDTKVVEAFLAEKGFNCVVTGKDDLLMIVVNEQENTNSIKNLIKETFQLHHSNYKIVLMKKEYRNSYGKISYKKILEGNLN